MCIEMIFKIFPNGRTIFTRSKCNIKIKHQNDYNIRNLVEGQMLADAVVLSYIRYYQRKFYSRLVLIESYR